MFLHPLAVADIAGDLGIEDEKAGLQFGDMYLDVLTVFFQYQLANRHGHVTLLTERSVT